MSRDIIEDSVDQSTIVRVLDATGQPVQDLDENTAGLALWYRRDGATKTAIAIASPNITALNDAHSDGGILHIDDGYYRLDVPDAAFAAGASEVVVGGAATGYVFQAARHSIVAGGSTPPTPAQVAAGAALAVAGDGTVTFQHDAGQTVYVAIFDAAGNVWDDADNTFTALGSATTPYLALTERSDAGGTGRSHYTATLPLGDINDGAAISCTLVAYKQAGGSPNLSTDSALSAPLPLIVEFSSLGLGEVLVQADLTVTSTSGTAVRLQVWLERNGVKLDVGTIDSGTTCSVDVREQGSASNLFTIAGTNADLQDRIFELEQSTPNFVDDRQYEVDASVVVDGVTYRTSHTLSVWG